MKLLLVRHAIAEDREVFAQTRDTDDQRPLTNEGRKRMKRAARGLHELIDDIDMIVSSPLVRAVQTADIIGNEYDHAEPSVLSLLAPDSDFGSFLEWLRRVENVQSIAAVGHEPHISGLASWLLTGSHKPLFEMKKGSAALLEFDNEVAEGTAKLRWFLTPAQLRLLGD